MTPLEQERLVMLAEECAEVIQIISKILRHGKNSFHPNNPEISNADLLRKEMVDVMLMVYKVLELDNIGYIPNRELVETWKRKLPYTYHQEESGDVS